MSSAKVLTRQHKVDASTSHVVLKNPYPFEASTACAPGDGPSPSLDRIDARDISRPWSRLVAELHAFPTPAFTAALSAHHAGSDGSHGGEQAAATASRTHTVRFLEELANSLIVLSWHDPTLCNYEEQVWTSATARCAGSCAFSGHDIHKGDPIYKPRVRGTEPPLNGHAMILASELAQMRGAGWSTT